MLVAKKLKQCEYQMRWGSMQLVVFLYMMMYTIFKFPVYIARPASIKLTIAYVPFFYCTNLKIPFSIYGKHTFLAYA